MKHDKRPASMYCFSKMALLAVVVMMVLGGALSGCGGAQKQEATDRPAGQSAARPQNGSVALTSDTKEEANNSPALERKVTREVSLVIVVSSVEEATPRLEEMVKGAGGYVQNADIWQANDRMQCNMILRVPAENLDGLLSRLEALGRLERKNITGKDVTEEYYDSSARKDTLEKQEKRLLELLNKANTVKDMLEIENELSRVRGQIESLQARLKVLDNLTSLATISVELRSPKSIATGETLKEPLGQRIKAAWLRGVNGMADVAEGVVVLTVTLIPYTPVLGVAGYVLYLVWKRKRPKE